MKTLGLLQRAGFDTQTLPGAPSMIKPREASTQLLVTS
jgi:hypothetical protein